MTTWGIDTITEDLANKIKSGVLRGKLKPQAKLADEYGVSRSSIVIVQRQLRAAGLIYGEQGRGVFVAKRRHRRT